MRFLLAFAFLLLMPAIAANAAGWGRYENARFGYGIDVPPDFAAMGEAQNGDGQVFSRGTQVLTVFGGNVTEADFEREIAWRKSNVDFNLTYEATTPSWASWSGKKRDRILYARAVALCGGTQYAMFELEYFAVDLKEMDPVVERLVRSLRPAGNGAGC
jgi:hypothetical protein